VVETIVWHELNLVRASFPNAPTVADKEFARLAIGAIAGAGRWSKNSITGAAVALMALVICRPSTVPANLLPSVEVKVAVCAPEIAGP
jgi:hypothetical protein